LVFAPDLSKGTNISITGGRTPAEEIQSLLQGVGQAASGTASLKNASLEAKKSKMKIDFLNKIAPELAPQLGLSHEAFIGSALSGELGTILSGTEKKHVIDAKATVGRELGADLYGSFLGDNTVTDADAHEAVTGGPARQPLDPSTVMGAMTPQTQMQNGLADQVIPTQPQAMGADEPPVVKEGYKQQLRTLANSDPYVAAYIQDLAQGVSDKLPGELRERKSEALNRRKLEASTKNEELAQQVAELDKQYKLEDRPAEKEKLRLGLEKAQQDLKQGKATYLKTIKETRLLGKKDGNKEISPKDLSDNRTQLQQSATGFQLLPISVREDLIARRAEALKVGDTQAANAIDEEARQAVAAAIQERQNQQNANKKPGLLESLFPQQQGAKKTYKSAGVD
jgi:hypothetical protein